MEFLCGFSTSFARGKQQVGVAALAVCAMPIGYVLTQVYSHVFSFSSVEFVPSFSFCSVPLYKLLVFFCPDPQMILLALSQHKQFKGHFAKT